MKKAGAIISLIAGVFAIFASIFTIVSGGFVSALDGGDSVMSMGFMGILFSFAVIIFGALSLSSESKTNGIILIVLSILGIILGGTVVAMFMALSFIGGILVAIGAGKSLDEK